MAIKKSLLKKNRKTGGRNKMKDPLLNLLISLSEKSESESTPESHSGIPITLFVGGIIISGEIVSKAVYYQQFAAGNVHDILSKFMSKTELATLTEGCEAANKYIHLSRVQFISTNGNSTLNQAIGTGTTFFWRGRLDRIDGFHVGKLKSV